MPAEVVVEFRISSLSCSEVFAVGVIMIEQGKATKILFIDEDEASFQIVKCMANVIEQLPPVELFHACDATEGLMMLDNVKPDVIVLNDDMKEERDVFIESLSADHPPILIQSEDSPSQSAPKTRCTGKQVTYVEKSGTLEGIHKTLLVATSVATKMSNHKVGPHIH